MKKLITFRSRKFIACRSKPSVLNNAGVLWCQVSKKKQQSYAGPRASTLGARDFSSAVSGFCQVFIDLQMDLGTENTEFDGQVA